MAPGKKAPSSKKAPSCPPSAAMEIPEEEDTDLSSLRARNTLRNNQFAHRLGIRRLGELLQSSVAKKKALAKSIGTKSKASLLGGDVGNTGDCVKAVTGRASKRVRAPESPEETTRCTRQRAARQVSTTSLVDATEVGLEPDLSANRFRVTPIILHKKQEKYKDSEPTAIDLFEELHCSKTKGFSEPVKKAIDDMHAQEAITSASVEGGQKAKTSIEAISKVLPKSNTFLRNVGIQQPAAKTTNVMKELQAELNAKKLESAGLQQELERLKAQAQESDAKVDKQAEEIESLRKISTDTQSLLRQMITFGQGQINPP